MIPVDQIVLLYETQAKSNEIIAMALEVSVDCVHVTLMEHSNAYRRAYLKEQATRDTTKPLADQMLDILVDLAKTSKDEQVSMSCAKFVRDDLKGRRDVIPMDAGIVEGVSSLIEKRLAALQDNKRRFLLRETVTIDAQPVA